MPLLSIDIEARYAKFQDAMTAVVRTAKKSAAGIQGAFSSVNSTLAGLGVSVSVGALAALVKSSIDAADHLNDLSKKTGVAVDVLGGLGFAAAQAGGDLDTIASAAGKLNKTIAEAGSGNRDAIQAFQALGISVEDAQGRLKTADKVLVEIADKFENLADGPEKARLALAYFSKAGADLIPLLNDGGEALRKNIEYYQRYAGITQDVAEKADAFNDTLEKIKLLSGAAGNQIAAELLPILQTLASQMLEVKESSGGFSAVGKAIRTVIEAVSVLGLETKFTFGIIGDEIGGTAAQLAALARLDFKAFANIGKEMAEGAAAARKENDKLIAQILDPKPAAASDRPTEKPKSKPPAPRLPGEDAGSRVIEGQLRVLERLSDRERELLASRNDFLQTFFQQDLISIRDYYAARNAAADEALQAQSQNIDKEIALLKSRRGKDANEQAQNQAKINELLDRKAQLQQTAGREALKSTIEQTAAAEQLARAIADINTQLIEQQGFTGEAAARRFDDQNRQLRQRLETELASANQQPDTAGVTTVRGSRALNNLDKLRAIAIAQGKINELQEIGARIQSDLGIASDRAQLAAANGSITELESLRQISDARAQSVADLQAVATAYAQMAEQTANPAIVQRAKEMQVEVEKLAASADLVRAKFEDTFSSGFESFFDKLTSGTATVSDAFKAMFQDINSEINRMVARDLSKALFGKEGGLGGVVDFASEFFGGKSKVPEAAGAAAASVAKVAGQTPEIAAAAASAAALTSLSTVTVAADASLVTLATTTLAVDAALAALTASALSAAAAMTAAAAAGASDSASGIFDILGAAVMSAKGNIFSGGNVVPFAKGGIPDIVSVPRYFPMAGGKTGLMGEAGPEAIMPLVRDGEGRLAVRLLGERGVMGTLKLGRDSSGRLAVHAANDSFVQKYAGGGIFGSMAPTFRTNASSLQLSGGGSMSMTPGGAGMPITAPLAQASGGDSITINIDAPSGTSRESAEQMANRTALALGRARRRNG
jgi:hypothetical protein